MSEDVFVDDSHDEVMELVLSSDEEFTDVEADGFSETLRREDRRVWWRDMAARFLPGVDAGAIIAAVASLIALAGALPVDQMSTASEISSQYNSSLSRNAAADPFATVHAFLRLRWIGLASGAGLAVVLGVLVLIRWKEGRHARWSRPVAQAALVIGLIGVVAAILGLTGTIGALPHVKTGSGIDSLSG